VRNDKLQTATPNRLHLQFRIPMNIAHHLTDMAAAHPAATAIKIPRGRLSSGAIDYLTLTFAELHDEVLAWQHHLAARDVRPGDHVLVMVRQGLPLIASVFALFRHGAVPVIIDPGMGLKSFLRCVAHTRPRVLLGIPVARVLSHICRRAFRSVEVRVSVSGSPLARARAEIPNPKSQIPKKFQIPNPKSQNSESELAAILFTSGSTGAPKGTCYEHAMFEAQIRAIRAAYDIAPGEVDLSMLPIFALFAPALGMTTIVPELDPSRPATLDPAKIVQAIQQEQVTNSFGSPTLWNKIADHCLARNITLPTLRRILCAGAPVPAALWEKAKKILPNGQLHSPYGATECLPVSTISGDEIAGLSGMGVPPMSADRVAWASRPCSGACIGRPAPETQIKIIAITDTPIPALSDARELPPNEIGEIIVTGPAVTREYDNLPEATAAAKILPGSARVPRAASGVSPDACLGLGRDAQASTRDACAPRKQENAISLWHRMGDTGYLDPTGRLWFCGRKAERVETPAGTLHTEPIEQIFRAHPEVARCALIALGDRATRAQTPAIVIQPAPKKLTPAQRARLAAELRALAQAHPHTQQITRFYFHPAFPVDVRHNAKIHRLALARWCARANPE